MPSPFDRNMGTKMAAKCVDWLIDRVQESKGGCEKGHDVYTDEPETATLLGLRKRISCFTPVTELVSISNFNRRMCDEKAWWMNLRPLLRILAKHESIYEVESVDGRAKEIDHADHFTA